MEEGQGRDMYIRDDSGSLQGGWKTASKACT